MSTGAAAPGARAFLVHPLLEARGVAHGFGLRTSPAVAGLVRPRQVHGSEVVVLREAPAQALGEADAVASAAPGLPIGVATADCVPILLASPAGEAVAAVHAGWRGLARGVVAQGVRSLAMLGAGPSTLAAVVGPHIGASCYEVDEPVLEALAARFGSRLDAALAPSRPGHARLDLGALVRAELVDCGLEERAVGRLEGACTHCHPERFHSYRRDGSAAGRLLHWIRARPH